MKENDKLILDLVDKVICHCPEHAIVSLNTIIENDLNLPEQIHLVHQIRSAMMNLNYIESVGNGMLRQIVLTDFGKEVKRQGGYYKYLFNIEKEEKKEELKFNTEIRNLESSIKLNEWLYKTKWLPLILSIIATILSIIALFAN